MKKLGEEEEVWKIIGISRSESLSRVSRVELRYAADISDIRNPYFAMQYVPP